MPIRSATASDIAALREIDALSFSSGDQYRLSYYEQIVKSDGFEVIAATDAQGIVRAWLLLDLRSDPMRIRSLAVHPQFRRRGLARALIAHAASRHHEPVDLLVEPENTAAIALYESCGFTAAAPDPQLRARMRMVREVL